MDISIRTPEIGFNYRAAAIIVHDGRILVLQDEGIPHDYLPGGRIRLGETAKAALERELREELRISLPDPRLVFVAETFFRAMDADWHELCLFFLTEASGELLARGDAFTLQEGREIHHFRWVNFADLAQLSFFPVFLKERIFSLPDHVEFISVRS